MTADQYSRTHPIESETLMMRLLLALVLALPALAAPNIVVFIADDHGEGDLSAYGHPSLRTPHIDQLAREGALFTNAFLMTSSCSPSRTSILTGKYPHQTGAEDLHTPLPADQKTMARYLTQAGYHTMAVGKWHLGDAERTHWSAIAECPAPQTADRALALLRDRPKDKPFFAWIASIDAHRPYEDGVGDDPHSSDDAVIPPYLPDHPAVRKEIAQYYDEVERFDRHIGLIRTELERQGVLDETFLVYLSDNGMPFPRAKTTLYDSGVRTPFVMRYPPLIEAGTVRRDLFSVVDLAPTLLAVAGVPQDSMTGFDQLQMLELPPAPGRTAVYSEANWHDYEQFMRAVRTERYLLIRNYSWAKPLWTAVDSVNSITWKGILEMLGLGRLTPAQRYVFVEPRPFEEFYDLQVDPASLENIIEEPQYRDEVVRHRVLLDNWRVETEDRMPLEPRLDGWSRDGNPLPHNQPWYDRFIEQGGRNRFDRF